MKRKKKHSPHEEQKVLAAQYRNEFLRKIKHIIDIGCGTHIHPLIPKSELENAYLCRTTSFKIKVGAGCDVPTSLVNDSKIIISRILREETITLSNSKVEISLSDYFTVLQTIQTLYLRLKYVEFEGSKAIRKALKKIIPNEKTYLQATEKLYSLLLSYSCCQSDIRKCMYWFKQDLKVPKEFPAEIQNLLEIHTVVPEMIMVDIEGKPRPALRVGWAVPLEGPKWLSLKPSFFGIRRFFNIRPLDVYIQSHALNRLSERIDCFWTGIIQSNMYESLYNPKVIRDRNNNILIEYRIFGIKAGYFRVDIIDKIVVIRTFLFITNNGTPEGQLLERNTGLQKLDKKYLAIDKLSTFLASDIGENEEVHRIFKDAGCGCLSELFTSLKSMDTKHAHSLDSEAFLKYLNSNKTDKDLQESFQDEEHLEKA